MLELMELQSLSLVFQISMTSMKPQQSSLSFYEDTSLLLSRALVAIRSARLYLETIA
jgi:hypothetical protein